MDNRRIITHKKIKITFLNMIKEKDPAHISAVELCNIAKINRSTFYDHFGYMDGLCIEVIKDQMNIVCDVKTRPLYDEDGIITKAVLKEFITHFVGNNILRRFFNSDRAFFYLKTMLDIQTNRTMFDLDNNESNLLHLYFINAGLTITAYYWLNNNTNFSVDEFVDIIHQHASLVYRNNQKQKENTH